MEPHTEARDSIATQVLSSPSNSSWSKETNQNQSELHALRKQLLEIHNEISFLLAWISPVQVTAVQPGLPKILESKPLYLSVKGRLQELQKRTDLAKHLLQQLVNVQKALAAYAMCLNPPNPLVRRETCDPFLPPQILLRGFSEASHCRFSKEFGIRASGYRACKPASTIDELIKGGELSEKPLKAHCEGEPKPTPWISMMNDPAWILKNFPNSKASRDADEGQIAFINVQKLVRMGVLFGRSDLLAEEANIPRYSLSRDGVKFTSVIHWLAYAWIPSQCIEQVWTFQEFADRCASRGIKEDSFVHVGPEELLLEENDDLADILQTKLNM